MEEQLESNNTADLEPEEESADDCEALLAIVDLLKHRLDAENFLHSRDRESVAYRLAEIMMCAKDLYTKRLQCLTAEHDERPQMGLLGTDTPPADPDSEAASVPEITVFDDLAYTRMHLIRLRDLICDFDGSFMEAMAAQREEEGNEETWLQDAEWEEEELEEAEDGDASAGADAVSDPDAWSRSDI